MLVILIFGAEKGKDIQSNDKIIAAPTSLLTKEIPRTRQISAHHYTSLVGVHRLAIYVILEIQHHIVLDCPISRLIVVDAQNRQ
jgi:hypothetical protein